MKSPEETTPNRALADYVANRRKELRLTLRELGERTGLSRTYLNNIERGMRGNPTPESIEGLARGLRVPPPVLYRLSVGLGAAEPTSKDQGIRDLLERLDRLKPSSLADILPLIDAMVARREELDGQAEA